MNAKIEGSLSIRISEDEMLAYLDFQPSNVIIEWTDELILGLLAKAGVKKGFKKFHFPRILSKIEKEPDEGSSHKIAYGINPVSVGMSKYKIKLKDMPESLESVYKQLMAGNSKPVVYPIQEDHFIGEEPENKALVVLNYFYVNEGQTVVEIDSEAKEVNGYTVTGKVLQPQKEAGVNFCIGRKLKIEKDHIISEESGFLRVGRDWIDLIPFKGHSMTLTASDDFAEYFLTFKPGSSDSPLPTFDDIIGLFSDIDYPLERLDDEKNILDKIKKSISDNKPVKFSLCRKIKAEMKIDINPSKTMASLVLEKGAGSGEKLSLKQIGELIRASKIKGMNLDSVKKRILSFYKSSELTLNYVILEGKSATRGEPRRLKYQKEFVSVDKIEGIVDRISEEVEMMYPSFKEFTKDDISSAILVKKDMEFAFLTESVPGDDGVDIYGNKIKGIVGNDPIIRTFENISVKQDKFISEIDGILDLGEVNGEIYLRVREHKDMFVDITVSHDAMNATFTFYKSVGSGERASIEFIKQQIADAGVVKGIDESVIEDSFNRFINGELISEVVFATGIIPTDKKSSRIRFFNNEGKSKFSYEVEKGAKLGQIFPSKDKAEDGFDVLGTVMESSGVVSLDLKIGDYILEEKQEDGSILLISDINGEFKADDKSITMVDRKVLPTDVSVKTGSVKTLCSLIVKGSVNPSLYVVSGGNIKIMGTVQGALISADKNIIVSQGVKGEDKAVLRAKEKIDVKFIEKANMMSVGDIHIRKAALHTKIISNGKIVFDKTGSKLIGGETFTKRGLMVDEIGSPSGSRTKISFGQDYLVADKINVFEKDVEKIQEDLMKIDQILQRPGAHLSKDKINHLRKQKVFLMKKLEKKNMRLFLLREKFEEHAKSEIIVRKRVYPGVIFESHGRKLEIMNEESQCKIVFNSTTGQIEKK